MSFPSLHTLKEAAKIAIQDERPIMLDYYNDSKTKKVKIKKTPNGETIIYKDPDEYTTPLSKLFKIEKSKTKLGVDIIALSENSIYIIHSKILQQN